MVHTMMPETETHLMETMRSAYIGFDPTADSLHIGNLVPIMLLSFYQRCGHKPYALVGGATGMIGDPSERSATRKQLTREVLKIHQDDVGHIPLHQQSLAWGAGKNVTLTQRADNYMPFKWMSIKP